LSSEVNHCNLRNHTFRTWIYVQIDVYVMVYIEVISARPGDYSRRMRRCTASLLGMTRAMNILAVIRVYCTGWKPCQDWGGFLKGPYIKLNLKVNGRLLRRSVSKIFLNITFSPHVMPYSLVEIRRNVFAFNLMGSSKSHSTETSVIFYQTACCHIADKGSIYSHHNKSLNL